MIREVRKGEELNLGSLKKFLLNKKLISDYQSELKIQQFSNGFSNLTYLIKIESRELVIRLPPKGARFGHDMSREFKVLSESAISLAKDDLNNFGGVLTTSTAMGKFLLKRWVDNAGLTFSFNKI